MIPEALTHRGHPRVRIPWLLLLLALAPPGSAPATASDEPAPYAAEVTPGHSWHGEAFNEGPRQQAYLMAGMPDVVFPITTTNLLTQEFFTQGVGQLHGFWYLEAERSFRQAHRLDTNAAMPFWGMTMANVRNETRARAFLTNAVARQSHVTPREQRYIQALDQYYATPTNSPAREARERRRDLVRAYEDLVRQHPEDLEARAFLLYQVWDNSGFGNNSDLRISSHFPLDLVARQILEKQPLHPVHHYRIHLWDPEQPLQALDSAAHCGQGGPGIAHLWHMPGHTYAKLARHDDAAWQQEASARVDHAQMIRDRLLPDQIHNYAHNNDWLVESWAFCGRVHEALDLARNMVELPRLARTNAALATSPLAPRYDFGSSSWQLGRRRLLQFLPAFELWDDLLELSTTAYLEATDAPEDQAALARARALAWFAKDDPDLATNELVAVRTALQAIRTERQAAVDLAEEKARRERKPAADLTKAMTAALDRFTARLDRMESFAAEIRARAALAAGDTNRLREELESARDIPQTSLALLHWDAGQTNKALELAREAAAQATNQVLATALHADLLWRAGRTNDAQTEFQRLRGYRAWPDLDLPVLRRLQPLAQSLGLPADWRIPHPPRDDTGNRPPLETLGPRHWHPASAPTWTLADAEGNTRSITDYRGRPLVVLFYLGRGCPHCLEQLNTFAPAAERFAAAGIQLVAVSTDSADALRRTFQKDGARRFPFPLLGDPQLSSFKAWRAFDDFEEAPLHGVFLVDGEGLLRWQDIGYEPFMDTEFLLREATRLLHLPPSRPSVAQAAL